MEFMETYSIYRSIDFDVEPNSFYIYIGSIHLYKSICFVKQLTMDAPRMEVPEKSIVQWTWVKALSMIRANDEQKESTARLLSDLGSYRPENTPENQNDIRRLDRLAARTPFHAQRYMMAILGVIRKRVQRRRGDPSIHTHASDIFADQLLRIKTDNFKKVLLTAMKKTKSFKSTDAVVRNIPKGDKNNARMFLCLYKDRVIDAYLHAKHKHKKSGLDKKKQSQGNGIPTMESTFLDRIKDCPDSGSIWDANAYRHIAWGLFKQRVADRDAYAVAEHKRLVDAANRIRESAWGGNGVNRSREFKIFHRLCKYIKDHKVRELVIRKRALPQHRTKRSCKASKNAHDPYASDIPFGAVSPIDSPASPPVSAKGKWAPSPVPSAPEWKDLYPSEKRPDSKRTPSKSTSKRTPSKSTSKRTPSKSMSKRTPSKSTSKRTPSKSTPKRTPSKSTSKKTPSKSTPKKTPPKIASNDSKHGSPSVPFTPDFSPRSPQGLTYKGDVIMSDGKSRVCVVRDAWVAFRRDPQLADQIESDAKGICPKTSTSILPDTMLGGVEDLRKLNRAQYKRQFIDEKGIPSFYTACEHDTARAMAEVRTGPTISRGVKRLFILENFNEYFDAEREALFSARPKKSMRIGFGRTSIELDSKMSSKIATVELICSSKTGYGKLLLRTVMKDLCDQGIKYVLLQALPFEYSKTDEATRYFRDVGGFHKKTKRWLEGFYKKMGFKLINKISVEGKGVFQFKRRGDPVPVSEMKYGTRYAISGKKLPKSRQNMSMITPVLIQTLRKEDFTGGDAKVPPQSPKSPPKKKEEKKQGRRPNASPAGKKKAKSPSKKKSKPKVSPAKSARKSKRDRKPPAWMKDYEQ